MPISYGASFFLICLHMLLQGSHSLQYRDLEALGISCPDQHKCEGLQDNSPELEKACECDNDCNAYGDCCIGAGRQRYRPAATTNVECLKYGEQNAAGIYAVSTCSRNWDGPMQVKRQCEGSADFSDLFSAAPITSTSRGTTYKNLYCAECNNEDLESLKPFYYNVACDGLRDKEMSDEDIVDQLSYDKKLKAWGLNRMDSEGQPYFFKCDIIFVLPYDLQDSVRFCRTNTISKCAPDWNRPAVAKLCDEYMAVVYRGAIAYKNPHCAICNNISPVRNLNCTATIKDFNPKFDFVRLVDLNWEKSCSRKEMYDPFAKKCRPLKCALPGRVLENGKCVNRG